MTSVDRINEAIAEALAILRRPVTQPGPGIQPPDHENAEYWETSRELEQLPADFVGDLERMDAEGLFDCDWAELDALLYCDWAELDSPP